MSAWTYQNDGTRIPLAPDAMAARLTGCLLCGRRVYTVGVFAPTTSEMRAAVAMLRRHPVPARTDVGLCYGLCQRHSRNLDNSMLQVEQVILAAAEKVTVQ